MVWLCRWIGFLLMFADRIRTARQPVISSYLDDDNSGTDSSTYSFTGMTLPGETGDYVIAAFLVAKEGSGGIDLSSATIDGQTAAQIYTFGHVEAAGASRIVFVIAPSTANATGTVAVTWNATAIRCGVHLWRIRNLRTLTVSDSGGDDGDDPSTTISVPKGGCGLALAYSGTGTPTVSWTGLTERSELMWDTRTTSAASDDFATTDASLAILANFSTAGNNFTLLGAISMR